MIKKVTFVFAFILASFTVSAQVGIGTPDPNASSILEIKSPDRGILIPRVELQSTVDNATITNGNVNSLLVFNTATTADVVPGYYYWFGSKWHRLAIGDELLDETLTTISIDPANGTITYTDEDGVDTILDLLSLVAAQETVTVLDDHNDGTYTYYNEDAIDANGDPIAGAGVLIDVTGDVVTNIQNQGDIYNEIVNVINNNVHTDTIIKNADGTYKHIAVDGTATLIDTTNSAYAIYDNTTSGLSSTTVQTAIDELVTTLQAGTGTLIDNANGTFTLQAADGTDLGTITKADLLDNTDGTYTFTNNDGSDVTINVIADVVTNISNQGDIYQEIINQLDSVYGNVYYDSTIKKFYYIDSTGVQQPIDWSEFNTVNTDFVLQNDSLTVIDSDGNNVQLAVAEIAENATFIDSLVTNQRFNDSLVNIIQGNETITTLVQNPDSTYTYTSEDGTMTTFKTIQVGNGMPSQPGNPGDVYIDKSTGNIYTYNNVTNSWELTAGRSDSLTNNNNGTYTHISVAGDTVMIDVPADVVTNISNQGDIYQEIINQLDSVYGNVYYDSSIKKFYYIDSTGVQEPIDWSEFNTVNTDFVLQNDSLTVIDSDGNNVQLAVAEIAENPTFIDSLITNNRFRDSINNLIDGNETLTILAYDDSTNQLTYTDEDNQMTTIQLGQNINTTVVYTGDSIAGNPVALLRTTTTVGGTIPSAVTSGVSLPVTPIGVVDVKVYKNGLLKSSSVTDVVITGQTVDFNLGLGQLYYPLPPNTYEVVIYFTVTP